MRKLIFASSPVRQRLRFSRNCAGEIVGILERHGVTVLQEDEWRKPVPWLRGGEEVSAGSSGDPIHVLDAFFLEGL
jgi:hypothetical protein